MLMSILLLLAGIHFMVMILAACYSVSDLWYRIGDFWLAITAKILLLVFADGAIFLLLPSDLQLAFFWGQAGYLAFHISIFWIAKLGIFWLMHRRG